MVVNDSVVIDILEDKTVNLQNEDGFGFASLLFGYFYRSFQDSRLKTQVSRLDLWEMKKLISSEVPSDC